MATNKDILVPARAIHPGEVLREELQERGIKQKDFANLIGMQATHLNEFLKGKRNLNEDLALKLEEHLGISFKFWMSLHSDYLYDCRQISQRKEDEQNAAIFENACIEIFDLKLLYKRLGIKAGSCYDRVSALKKILPFDILNAKERSLKISGLYKRSERVQINERNMMTWLILNWIEISNLEFDGCYKKGNGYKAAELLAKLANEKVLTIDKIKQSLNTFGICYAVVPKIERAPIDAYSTIKGLNPVITVTYRYNDLDKLVFDIIHELCHIERHLNEDHKEFISVDSSEYSSDRREIEANEYTRDTLIPPDVWSKILNVGCKSLSPYKVVKTIAEEAKKYSISPSIAVSRYKHDTNWYQVSAYKSPKIYN